MNTRLLLALVLTALVIVATPLLFPNTNRERSMSTTSADTTHTVQLKTDSGVAAVNSVTMVPKVMPNTSSRTDSGPVAVNTGVEIRRVPFAHVIYTFRSPGAGLSSVELPQYISRRPGAGKKPSELVPPHNLLTRYRLALGRDTVSLDTIPLQLEIAESPSATPIVTYSGRVVEHDIRFTYTFGRDTSDAYLIHAKLIVAGAPAGSALIIQLPRSLESNEPDTLDDQGHLAVSYRTSRGEINSSNFSSLKPGQVQLDQGPINWIATRNKYFLVVYRAVKRPFAAVTLGGIAHEDKVAPNAYAAATLPLEPDGTTTFDIYAGPQQFERLQRLGGDLDQVNPYAGWLHGVVQPFATVVMRALLWMKRTTQLNYGWVLVLFGIIVRLVLWPLNQGAMRTSMKMQRLQPQLQALQKKHGDDPKRQQEAIMKVYKEHGMSPLSPLMGCLPMLLPMPVLFALYYVFQNTIEFRGVPFLWLPDISLKDPYFITPLLMGVSMFIMSWIGMRNSPPNPQAKMMSYMMPVMLTVLFINFASGLNLYYAVQNIAALPQQWLLARERGKESVRT